MKKIVLSAVLIIGVVVFTACQKETPTKSTTTSSSAPVSSEQSTKASSKQQQETGNADIMITLEEAIKKYQDIYPDTDIIGIDLDKTLGKYYYEISGVNDETEFEVDVNAVTGEAKEDRSEKLDRDEQNGVKRKEEALDLEDLKELGEISAAAEKAAGSGEAIEWKLEKEMSITYWEVKVKDGQQEFDVKINAQTLEVLEKEQDD